MAIEINGKVYRNIQEQVAENQDNITELRHDVDIIQYLIDSGEIGITIDVVEELPTEDINPHCIYLVPSDNPDEDNIYYEYMYIDDAWELIGSTATDLSDYYTKTETDTAINNAKELYYCTYGTTTFAQITQALSDGKLPICFYDNKQYVYVGLSTTNRHTFASQLFETNRYISITNADSWGGGIGNFEITTNKIQTITSSSTTTQYPSAKATYNFGTGLMTPSQMATATINSVGEALFTFTGNVFNASNNKGLGTFTMGNCFFMIPLYGLTQGTTYKTNGTFVYSSLGEVVSTTINYKITNNTTITVWSGNSNFTMQEGYTAYLSLLRLF